MNNREKKIKGILKQIYLHKNITREMVAKHLKVSLTRVSYIFKANDLKLSTLIKLCDACGLDIHITIKQKNSIDEVNINDLE